MGGLRVQYQPITLTLAGYAQGRKIARKTRARPRNGRASSRAKPTPRLSLATLVTAAYRTVTVAARQNSGSARERRVSPGPPQRGGPALTGAGAGRAGVPLPRLRAGRTA